MTRSAADVARVKELAEQGLSQAAIARATDIPRQTLRAWLSTGVAAVLEDRLPVECDGARCALVVNAPPSEYAYLLGQYLGDGHIASHRRGVSRLVITCCDWYPNIVDECASAMRAVMPRNAVGFRKRPGVVLVSSYSKHWPCLFPQHGPGKKHERRIKLTEWQQEIVADSAKMFVRGLIHSDGCRDINRVCVRGRWYAYSRYSLRNESADILKLFAASCDALGVQWRYSRNGVISVARRGSVAFLDEFIGPKT